MLTQFSKVHLEIIGSMNFAYGMSIFKKKHSSNVSVIIIFLQIFGSGWAQRMYFDWNFASHLLGAVVKTKKKPDNCDKLFYCICP